MAHGEWTFDWLTRWDEVWADGFQSQWKAWMEKSENAHVFFEPPIVRAWYETYMPLRRIEPRFLVARRGDGTTVFWPLVWDRGGAKDAWQRMIAPAGHCEFDYHDPIAVGRMDEILWSAFWDGFDASVGKRWGKRVDRVDVGRISGEIVPDSCRSHDVDEIPTIEVDGATSLLELLAGGRHKKLRQEITRKEREIARVPGLVLHRFTAGEADEAISSIDRFAAEHSRRWPSASTPYVYYGHLLRYCLGPGLVHFSELRSASDVLSWKFCFCRNGRLDMYVQAMSSQWEHVHPGSVHTARVVDWATESGFAKIALGRGTEPWKRSWATTSSDLRTRSWPCRGMRARTVKAWNELARPCLVAAKRCVFGPKVSRK